MKFNLPIRKIRIVIEAALLIVCWHKKWEHRDRRLMNWLLKLIVRLGWRITTVDPPLSSRSILHFKIEMRDFIPVCLLFVVYPISLQLQPPAHPSLSANSIWYTRISVRPPIQKHEIIRIRLRCSEWPLPVGLDKLTGISAESVSWWEVNPLKSLRTAEAAALY